MADKLRTIKDPDKRVVNFLSSDERVLSAIADRPGLKITR